MRSPAIVTLVVALLCGQGEACFAYFDELCTLFASLCILSLLCPQISLTKVHVVASGSVSLCTHTQRNLQQLHPFFHQPLATRVGITGTVLCHGSR
jgi:hypothetical protein